MGCFVSLIKSKVKNRKNKREKPLDAQMNIVVHLNIGTKVFECPICLGEDSTGLIALNCHNSHLFHKICITEWYERHNTCPLCRVELDFQFIGQKVNQTNTPETLE